MISSWLCEWLLSLINANGSKIEIRIFKRSRIVVDKVFWRGQRCFFFFGKKWRLTNTCWRASWRGISIACPVATCKVGGVGALIKWKLFREKGQITHRTSNWWWYYAQQSERQSHKRYLGSTLSECPTNNRQHQISSSNPTSRGRTVLRMILDSYPNSRIDAGRTVFYIMRNTRVVPWPEPDFVVCRRAFDSKPV